MKRIGYIFFLGLIWIICGSRSCGNGESLKEQREKMLLTASRDSIKQAFEVDSPSDQLLKAYEAKAIQKLSDFAEYLKIASDTSLDLIFRKHASEMGRKLFIPGEIVTRDLSTVYQMEDLNALDKLLEEMLKKGSSSWIQPDQINVIKPMMRENDSSFKGRLSFKYIVLPFGKPITTPAKTGKLEIDFYAHRRAKNFGTEQLRVWEVYLGNIN